MGYDKNFREKVLNIMKKETHLNKLLMSLKYIQIHLIIG